MKFSLNQLALLMRRFGIKPPPDAEPNAIENLIREAMRQERRKILKEAQRGERNSLARARNRRVANAVVRQRFQVGRNRQARLPKDLLAWAYHRSALADALVPERRKTWIPILRRDRNVVPSITFKDFSFVDNPFATMEMLKEMVLIEGRAAQAHIHFEDEECLDIGAYLVLGELWPSLSGVFTGGKMNVQVQKALKAVGLGQHLNISLRWATNIKDIWAYPLQRRRPRNTSTSSRLLLEPQRRERVADGLCDAIDEWLDRPEIAQELTIEGRAWIASLVGELLDNAERHSAPDTKDGEWSTAAFMVRRKDAGDAIYSCHMAFLSVGVTISDSLATAATEIQEWLAQFLAHHEVQNVSADTLRTLFALQDGITRDAEATADRRGGLGFQEVLHFVNELGGTKRPGCEPRVTIISGRSCLQLRAPYLMGSRKSERGPRVLWCNERNSPNDPPDSAFVYDLPNPLAGTLISIAFTLDPEYLRQSLESENEDDQAG